MFNEVVIPWGAFRPLGALDGTSTRTSAVLTFVEAEI